MKLPKFLHRVPRPPANRQRLGLLAIMKNEAMTLREWVDHYRWQGVDRIFLIDNGSTDDGPALLTDHIDAGYIELFRCPEPHRQTAHYQNVFAQADIRNKVEWLIMADLDEFWFCPFAPLPEAIGRLGNMNLVYANWKMFGSSGHVAQPPSVRRFFTLRQPELSEHADTKWICRTDAIADPRHIGLHKVSGVDSATVVSDNHLFHLNHYPIQSVEYFTKVKMGRGDASSPQFDAVRDMDYFRRYDAPAVCEDRLLADLVPA